MRAFYEIIGVTTAADVLFQCEECVLTPGLADLFEPFSIVSAATHPVKILRNKRVIGGWQLKPVDWLVGGVTGICPYGQTNLCADGRVKLCHVLNLSNNNIRPWHQGRRFWTECMF